MFYTEVMSERDHFRDRRRNNSNQEPLIVLIKPLLSFFLTFKASAEALKLWTPVVMFYDVINLQKQVQEFVPGGAEDISWDEEMLDAVNQSDKCL